MKFEIDPSKIKSSWDDFAKYYDINPNSTSYPKLMEEMIALQNDDSYPNILFPDEVVKNSVKLFKIGDYEPKEVTDSLYLKNFLSERYKLFGQQLEDERIEYLYKPKILPKPVMRQVPKTKMIEYFNYHISFWVPFFLVSILPSIAGFYNADSVLILIISTVLFVGAIISFIYIIRKFADRKFKEVKLTEDEIKQNRETAEKEYAEKLKEYENNEAAFYTRLHKYELEQKKNMRKIEGRFDERIRKFNKYYKVTKSLSAIRAINCPKRGRSENLLFKLLMERYPKYVKIDMQVGQYFPDICIIIPQGNITLDEVCIDIEIDEPYAFGTKEETHYIGCGDEQRNDFFNENGWYVIRFTEKQVLSDSEKCLDIISALIVFLQSVGGKVGYILTLKNQIKEDRWSKEEARLMAIYDSRSKYDDILDLF